MKILKLDASNIDGLLSVERACFRRPWTREMFSEEFENPLFSCFGTLTEDGTLVGFICFWTIIDEIHIGNVAVHPNFRRRGAAKTMLAALLKAAHLGGIKNITLEVRRGNAAAIALYTSAGFSAEGVRPRYYWDGEDALIMWKREN